MSVFRIKEIVRLPTDEAPIVILGDVVDGEVRSGMVAVVQLNSGLSFEVEIKGVESTATRTGVESHLALVLEGDEDLFRLLDSMGLAGEMVEVQQSSR